MARSAAVSFGYRMFAASPTYRAHSDETPVSFN
jgi:hypothetical protein